MRFSLLGQMRRFVIKKKGGYECRPTIGGESVVWLLYTAGNEGGAGKLPGDDALGGTRHTGLLEAGIPLAGARNCGAETYFRHYSILRNEVAGLASVKSAQRGREYLADDKRQQRHTLALCSLYHSR